MNKSAVLPVAMGAVALLSSAILGGCGGPQDSELSLGKKIWEANCQVCHFNGIAGAPKFGDSVAWQTRIAKGEDVLIEHALQGFEGGQGLMPARGGNAALTDNEVQAAVRYMVSHSR